MTKSILFSSLIAFAVVLLLALVGLLWVWARKESPIVFPGLGIIVPVWLLLVILAVFEALTLFLIFRRARA